jgi:hypothetical protein
VLEDLARTPEKIFRRLRAVPQVLERPEEIPAINYELTGAISRVTDYIEVDNPALKGIAAAIPGVGERQIAEEVLRWNAEKFRYPFDYRGRPATAREVHLFKWWGVLYNWQENADYGWLFPRQVIRVGFGICIDTANLDTTMLLIKGVKAKTCLGVVLDKKGKLLGMHAWTLANVEGRSYVLETTAHPRSPGLIPAEEIYSTVKYGIRYDELAAYDNVSYVEDREKADRYTREIEKWQPA